MKPALKDYVKLYVYVDFYTSGQVKFLEFVYGLNGWFNDVDETLVGSKFKLVH